MKQETCQNKKDSSKPIEALIPTTKLMEDDNVGKNNEMWIGGFHAQL